MTILGIGDMFSSLISTLGNVVDAIVGFFQTLIDIIVNFFSIVINGIKFIFTGIVSILRLVTAFMNMTGLPSFLLVFLSLMLCSGVIMFFIKYIKS